MHNSIFNSILVWLKRRKRLLVILLIFLTFYIWKHTPSFRTRQYNVEISVYPIKSGDYSMIEKLCGALFKYNNKPTPESKNQVDFLSRNFTFSNKVCLINYQESWGKTSHTFSIESILDTTTDSYSIYKFEKLNLDSLKPITIKLYVPVKPFAFRKPQREIDYHYLTTSTESWPVNDSSIQKLTCKIINADMSHKERVFKILGWMKKNIKWSRDQGTRCGAKNVIKQGFGRCWDFSDVFITLCRAAGIPARQVYGIVYKKGGHAWSEVYLEDKGWVPIDAPRKRLGVENTFIPISISEDGNMTLVYTSAPKVERIK